MSGSCVTCGSDDPRWDAVCPGPFHGLSQMAEPVLELLRGAYRASWEKVQIDYDCRGCGFRFPQDPRGHVPGCPVLDLIKLIRRIEADPTLLGHAADYPEAEDLPEVSPEQRAEYERQRELAPLVVAEVERWKVVAGWRREERDVARAQALVVASDLIGQKMRGFTAFADKLREEAEAYDLPLPNGANAVDAWLYIADKIDKLVEGMK